MKKRLLAIICAIAVMFSGVANFTYRRTHADESQVIPIAMAADNNYTYPLIVAMTSILENKNPDTKIDFYVMLSGDFLDENKAKIMSLQNKYDHCRITLIDMKDKLKDVYISRHVTEATYYRLMLASILPELDKVLYLDSDIIVQKDLSDLYSQDLENYYLAGVLDVCVCGDGMVDARQKRAETERDFFIEKFGVDAYKEKYICAAVTLFNLKKIREDNRHIEFMENAKMYSHMYHDQDVLNFVCFDQILVLSDVYHKDARFANPSEQVIIHYASRIKPWNTPTRRLANLWYEYAKKTDYYNEIKEWSSQLRANIASQAQQKKNEFAAKKGKEKADEVKLKVEKEVKFKPIKKISKSKQMRNTHQFKLRRVA